MFAFCLFFAFVSFCSYENHCSPAILVFFRFNVLSISVSHFSFWFLLFVFVMFAFCFKMFLCLCYSDSFLRCFQTHYWVFSFGLHISLVGIFCFGILLFFDVWLPIKNISKTWKFRNMKNAEQKTDILARAVSTGVFTNSVCVCVSSNFAFFAEITIKIVSPTKTKRTQKITILCVCVCV